MSQNRERVVNPSTDREDALNLLTASTAEAARIHQRVVDCNIALTVGLKHSRLALALGLPELSNMISDICSEIADAIKAGSSQPPNTEQEQESKKI